ncbi:MAG TPA: nucleoside kinase [Candidatus Limiplasma sp.]|nr:nucleoside kinase [Candidatus Limiplasma sp.]
MSSQTPDHLKTVQITLNGATAEFSKGTPVLEAFRQLSPELADHLLCAQCGGVCMELDEPLTKNCALTGLTYRDEEGRRVYERSLRFLLLLSMSRLFPKKQVRILNSVGYGVYLRVLEEDMDHAMVRALEQDMRKLVAQNLPFEKETWTREQAIAYFTQHNDPDKADVLRYRPGKTIAMYRIGDMREYFYGAMTPSTGYLKHFSLKPHFPGLVLCMPAPGEPARVAPYSPRPKHLRVFNESQEWCRILGASNVADVNRMIEQGKMREFIRVNEALQDKSIAHIADEIVTRNAQIVLVFGPSSSGKTTFAHRLAVHLQVLGKRPQLVSLDDFYKARDDAPRGADGKPDLEDVEALDIPLLSDCIEQLLSAEWVQMPKFDFVTGKRTPETTPMLLAGNGPLILEGIHALNDRVTRELPEQLTYGVYVSALPCINLDNHNRIRTTDVRLLRRITRDAKFRGTAPEATIDMWPSVRAGEEKWIFPNQEKADVMFNTSLHYELPILKRASFALLSRIPETEPEALVAHRLLKFLQYFLPVEEGVIDEIPPLSILREFIGECTFYDRH